MAFWIKPKPFSYFHCAMRVHVFVRSLLFNGFLLFVCALAGTVRAQGDTLSVKRMSVLGDSYVANHRRPYQEAWHYLAAQQLGMEYQNLGRNGSCVAWNREPDGFGPSMLERYEQLDSEADLVIVIAGHNDAGYVGESKDSLRIFRDAMERLIDGIRAHCPHARVAWVTPWYVDREGFRQVVKCIRKVCKRKGVPVLNNYAADCCIKVRDEEFRRRFFQGAKDTAHLNAAGHRLFLPIGLNFIKEVME